MLNKFVLNVNSTFLFNSNLVYKMELYEENVISKTYELGSPII